MLGLLCL
jgi:hypothetical protein